MDAAHLRRDIKLVMTGVMTTVLASLVFWFAIQPLGRISKLEDTVSKLHVDLSSFHQDHEDLKATVTQQHQETMTTIEGLRQELLTAPKDAARAAAMAVCPQNPIASHNQ